MTNKKEAAVLAHCDPKKVERLTAHSITILPQLLHKVKLLACRMLCILMVLLAVAFVGSWIQGMRGFAETAFLAGVSMMLAACLLIYAEGGDKQ